LEGFQDESEDKKSTILYPVCVKEEAQTPNSAGLSGAERQYEMNDGEHIQDALRASQQGLEKRSVLIENLRAQIQDGTYTIDSKVVAECMLKNEKHFV
jgi:anti-sigma28 factor (negative regulator of flagellin synthesis)